MAWTDKSGIDSLSERWRETLVPPTLYLWIQTLLCLILVNTLIFTYYVVFFSLSYRWTEWESNFSGVTQHRETQADLYVACLFSDHMQSQLHNYAAFYRASLKECYKNANWIFGCILFWGGYDLGMLIHLEFYFTKMNINEACVFSYPLIFYSKSSLKVAASNWW